MPRSGMKSVGEGGLHSAVLRKNGEAYQLLGELLGECSACDLHLAMSLLETMRNYGFQTPTESLVLQPVGLMQRRQRRRQQSQLAFNTRFAKNWFWRQQSFGADLSDGVASWNHLPQDLLLRIAQNLGDEDRQVLGCCCSAWRTAIGQSTQHASFVWAGRQERDNLDCHPMIDKVVRGAAVIFTDLQSANFRRCELLSSDALVSFCQKSCRNLQELDLSGCESLTDVGVIAVAENCPLLEVLRLASCQRLTDCTFVALGSFCNRLKAISACGCGNLSDLGITCLAQGARGLRDVNVGWCEALTDEGITSLAEYCPNLLSVDLCGCLQIGDEGIAALARRCPGLRSLGLHCCRRLTDASQKAVASNLRSLSSLNISGCQALSSAAVQDVVDNNAGLHTCGGINRNVIVAGCMKLLAVRCSCPTQSGTVPFW